MIHLKSEKEIDSLRAAADLVARTLGEVARHVRPGVSTRALDRVAEAFIRQGGGRPAFKGYGSPKNPFPATLCTSVNDVVVHGIPTDLELKDGDLLTVDCGVVLDGYYGDSAFTFGVGDIGEEKARLCRVTYESLQRAVDACMVGNRIGDIGFAVQEHCEGAGYGVVRDLVGHGIGRELHEEPSVPNFGRRGHGRRIREGLSICIEPMVNVGTPDVRTDRDGWTVRTADGQPSAHYEHMVVIRPGGPEVLTTFQYVESAIPSLPYAAPSRAKGQGVVAAVGMS